MDASEELLFFANEWDQVITRNDVEEISGFMSDDWVIVGSDGITTKATFLASIASGDLTHSQMDSDKAHVKMHGDTGLVVSRGNSIGTYKGNAFAFYEWSTSVYKRKDDSWICVLTMLTPAQSAGV